ncbi:hypothetical protein BVG16_16230 [Paenibacillus selenitireducens]|uniref:Uncharacterized protein n=1 Tax=Paenibacillus selenitireducens TaxID=1324314 RepID=A0A1T2X9Z0_9BACL|nr:hypothetical protein [Paenibacillus selenitireducens]OPA76717.1 hypothetical protein BVG16_16230 [Paenibacillus selenitireducens]
MAEKRRQKLIYFGKRDDAIWDAIQAIPDGDQNFHMKEAFRMYFLTQDVTEVKATPSSLSAVHQPAANEDHTDKIDLIKLSGSMIL